MSRRRTPEPGPPTPVGEIVGTIGALALLLLTAVVHPVTWHLVAPADRDSTPPIALLVAALLVGTVIRSVDLVRSSTTPGLWGSKGRMAMIGLGTAGAVWISSVYSYLNGIDAMFEPGRDGWIATIAAPLLLYGGLNMLCCLITPALVAFPLVGVPVFAVRVAFGVGERARYRPTDPASPMQSLAAASRSDALFGLGSALVFLAVSSFVVALQIAEGQEGLSPAAVTSGVVSAAAFLGGLVIMLGLRRRDELPHEPRRVHSR